VFRLIEREREKREKERGGERERDVSK